MSPILMITQVYVQQTIIILWHYYYIIIIAGEISTKVAHIMVPNPKKSVIAETQARLTDIIYELEKNLSGWATRFIMLVGDRGMNAS